jgi:starch phosphorylase
MRESMARLTPLFSAHRAVREYAEQRYLPAATAYRERAANKGTIGKQVVDWRHSLEQKWPALHFGEVKIETRGEQHIFEVELSMNGLDPQAVRVELYADGVMGGAPVRHEMKLIRSASGTYVYGAAVRGDRPETDYTARVIPQYDGVAVPLEVGPILWQR